MTTRPVGMSVAIVKRFVERWVADARFRKIMPENPRFVTSQYGLDVDPEAVRPIWDPGMKNLLQDGEERLHGFPLLKEYEKHLQLMSLQACATLADESTNPRYRAWRKRQVARTACQFDHVRHDDLLHITFAFELTKGCSVGCWFCSENAPPLDGIFGFTPENAKLWREILIVARNVLGPAASTGICYWGTEPFDNPDHEAFCEEFYDVMGVFPRTTTAIPLADPERTRSLLRASQEKGCTYNRFSLHSIRDLERVHREFTPEELLHVGVTYRGEGSYAVITGTGRAGRDGDRAGIRFNSKGTNACVSGLLVNMVDKKISLITPCIPSSPWPRGYWIFQTLSFSNADEFLKNLRGMIDRHMPISIPDHWILKFRPDLKFRKLKDGFQVSSKLMKRTYGDQPYVRELGNIINKGTKKVSDAISVVTYYAVPPSLTRKALNLMFEEGILDESPTD